MRDRTLEDLSTRCRHIQRLSLSWCGSYSAITNSGLTKYGRSTHAIYFFCVITAHNGVGEGNVFRRVCLSIGPHVTTYEPVQTCSLGNPPPPQPVQTCSLGNPPPPDLFKLVHYVARASIVEWAVGRRLKCLLVL